MPENIGKQMPEEIFETVFSVQFIWFIREESVWYTAVPLLPHWLVFGEQTDNVSKSARAMRPNSDSSVEKKIL